MVSHMLTRQDFESIKTGMSGRYSKQRLPIVKKCVELLKGEIQVNSVYGRGSQFTVTLPRDLPGPPAVLEAAGDAARNLAAFGY